MSIDTNNAYNKKPLWFWIIIYLVIGGLVYAGIYFAYYNKTSPATPVASVLPANLTVVSGSKVEYTGSGFAPATLTIAKGETVTWQNTSSSAGNVSSDPHPTHTDYPPLNLGMLKPGTSLSLKFDVAGDYHYHNHLNSAERGTIIVK